MPRSAPVKLVVGVPGKIARQGAVRFVGVTVTGPRGEEVTVDSNSPGCDGKAFVTGKSATRWCMHILCKLAITGIPRGDATAQCAPSPETEAITCASHGSGASEADLPVLRTVC